MTIYWEAVFGFFPGFGFGVGCAHAVMYSIFLGGYRAALRDCELATPPERLQKARLKIKAGVQDRGGDSDQTLTHPPGLEPYCI